MVREKSKHSFEYILLGSKKHDDKIIISSDEMALSINTKTFTCLADVITHVVVDIF